MSLYSDSASTLSEPNPYPLSPEPNFPEPLPSIGLPRVSSDSFVATESAYPKGILKDISPSDIPERIAVRERFESSDSKGIASAIPPLGSYTLTDKDGGRPDNLSALSRALSGVRHDKNLYKFYGISRKFIDYLRWMDSAGLSISGFNNETNKSASMNRGMSHRWTTLYRKKLLKKLYLLDEYMKDHPSSVTLMTLTTFQELKYRKGDDSPRLSIPEAFMVLKKSWKKLSMLIRYWIPGTEYILIVEPQKSGYPHFHIALFTDISPEIQDKIKQKWEKYQAGDYEHGAQFEIKKPEESIKSLRNYLMKYIAKGFVSTGSRFGEQKWTPAELVFNACVWDGNYRTFQPSRGLQKYMGWTPGKDDAIYWHTNEMKYESYGEKESSSVMIWERSLLGWIPGRVLEPDPFGLLDEDDLSPEDEITRQRWHVRAVCREIMDSSNEYNDISERHFLDDKDRACECIGRAGA